MSVSMWSKRNSDNPLAGGQIGATTWERDLAITCKVKHSFSGIYANLNMCTRKHLRIFNMAIQTSRRIGT